MVSALRSKINFEKTNYYILLAFAFMMPLSRATNSLFDALLILLLLVQGDYKKHFNALKESAFAKAILLFIAFTTLSLLWTDNLEFGLNFKRLYWQWFAIFAIALNVKREQVFPIVTAFIFGMVISEILSYGMFFEFWTIRGNGKEYPSPFMMHIDYSVFLAFTAIILLNRLISNRYTKNEKLLIFFFFVTLSGNLFMNDGRTGQLALLVGIFATVFIHYKITYKSIIGSTLIIVLIFGLAYSVSDKFQTRVHAAQNDIKKIMDGQLQSSWGARVAMYFIAADIVKEHPIIGVGVGDYKDEAKAAMQKDPHGLPEVESEGFPISHFHNQYVNVLVQGGIIGLVLMLMMFYQFAKLSIADPELKELSLLIIVVMLTSFVAEPLWLKQFTNMLFILFSGLFLGASLHAKPVSDNPQS
ncbi:MAG: O-antigen ligase family protein [Helicobacteraceae bacterium]|jgi:O-antigen ligase|nr:O-antigen ligase family protein [Helicobacteraceae bacterium]